MASNFNDDAARPGDGGAGTGSPAGATASPALARFNTCRWQQPEEDGNAAFCTHREVKPYAGATAFDAAAWCPECQYFKLRRTPKKRIPGEDYGY